MGNRLRFCSRNEDAHDALLALIRSAQERLLLSVFSLEVDAAGLEVIAAMTERAAAGGRFARYRPLVAAGSLRGALNYRNHRKIVVADGREARVGGRNMALKYLASSPDGSHWADLSLLVEGPAAAVFESVFCSDWLTASGESIEVQSPATSDSVSGNSCIQVLAARPDLEDDTLHALLIAGIAGAGWTCGSSCCGARTCGSQTLDMRSLFTNHEVAAVLYRPGDIESVAAIVEDWAAQCVADVAPQRFAKTALAGALRIIAPLL